jgi:hypothetical protein
MCHQGIFPSLFLELFDPSLGRHSEMTTQRPIVPCSNEISEGSGEGSRYDFMLVREYKELTFCVQIGVLH